MHTRPLRPYEGPTEEPPASAAGAALGPGSLVGGKYRVEKLLGRGGMGEVYLAFHEQLGRRVAIKVLQAEAADDPGIRTRFRREAVAASTLASAHIAEVSDVGELPPPRQGAAGVPYMVMEYLQGRDLAAHLAEHGALPIVETVDLLGQLCEGVRVAHVAGVVHRDLKPANLFLVPRAGGSPLLKILDFGIAKAEGSLAARDTQRHPGNAAPAGMTQLTGYGGMLGSARYMAPEQMESARDVDGRADIWSIGVIGYKLLTGRVPFEAESPEALFVAMITQPFVPLASLRPDAPPALIAAVEGCLRPTRDDRWPTIEALAGTLAYARGPAGVPLDRPSITEAPTRPDAAPLSVEQRPSITQGPTLAVPPEVLVGAPLSLPRRQAWTILWLALGGFVLVGTVLLTPLFFAWRTLTMRPSPSADPDAPYVMPGYTLGGTLVEPIELLPRAQAEAAVMFPGQPLSLTSFRVYNANQGPLRLVGDTSVLFELARPSAEQGAMVSFSATGVFRNRDDLHDEPRIATSPRCGFAAARSAAMAAGYVQGEKNYADYGRSVPNTWRFHNLARKAIPAYVDVDGATCAVRKR